MLLKSTVALAMALLCQILTAQSPGQTIRGSVTDTDTRSPLIGATVQIIGSEPILGALTDVDGNFRMTDVPLGRVDLLVNYIGYEPRTMSSIIVGAGKEVLLNVKLIESVEALEAVIVTVKKDKSEVLNEMALVSARSFTVDETKRFAGSLNDPARMVASYAGVQSNAEGSNEIVVRGNSSKGILWRLEGMEIPNPNHFANEGSTGGAINAMNSNMLDDSDFFTGAFAPEYGNALSGVFDMKLKKGNNEKREYTATASTLGLDLTVEGPFSENYNGSYLANYRYSSIALLAETGLLDFGGIPKYQDLSFNINLPVNKKHYLSIFGLGGVSNIAGDNENDEGVTVYRSSFDAGLGVVGLNHNYLINQNAFIKNAISFSGTTLNYNDNIPEGNGFQRIEESDLAKGNIRMASTLNYKLNARHKVETGVIFSLRDFSIEDRRLNFETDLLETGLSDKGKANVFQAFTSWRYRIGEQWTVTSGLHFLQFGLNNNYSLEPRVGARWDFSENQALTVGAGIHSKLESIAIYLGRQTDALGNSIMRNRDLDISKAAHLVLGYSWQIRPNTNFKAEAYYQHLYDIPVENDLTSSFSLSNVIEDYTTVDLVNEGTGKNYGIELTLEQYLTRGFYYLTTLSLYESLYTPLDGLERKSRFAGNYVANLLVGKEFNIGKPGKRKVLFVNGKLALLGGTRYTPIDLQASIELGSEVLLDAPFSARGDDLITSNFSIGTRRNKGKTTREFKIDIQNVTNAQANVSQYYIEATEEIYEAKQLPFLPTIMYSINF